jgi:hypothetical protein
MARGFLSSTRKRLEQYAETTILTATTRSSTGSSEGVATAKLLCFLLHPISTNAGSAAETSFHGTSNCAKIFLSDKPKRPGGDVDKRLKSMMKELGDAINNSLSDSDEIAEVISRIKDGGYDVFVVLEATIGFNSHSEDDSEETLSMSTHSAAEFEMTSQDLKFLKSLRISVGEER